MKILDKLKSYIPKNKLIRLLYFAISLAVLFVFAHYLSLVFGPNNPLEQAVEWIIKTKTGLDIDLTPGK